ncbi:hypothetical protein O6H91_19G048700 [Diphasiastrum complanatum]|uniref:Uncharacterized protein n=1 Tax=Diphasiastrum complanatum TaxID=34168 RepID=A0ACC2AV46_DIPCM|nr:hypothetical protein O6H91_19G048700 [Diphasiastrum complanatum]
MVDSPQIRFSSKLQAFYQEVRDERRRPCWEHTRCHSRLWAAASCSTERLEVLDDEQHVLSFRVLGGEHRLQNYHSVTTLHDHEADGRPETLVIESYVVDVPKGNTKEDTSTFTNTLVRCNLRSLAKLAESVTYRLHRMM